MTYQLLNENYVCKKFEKYEHQKCYLFKCLYLIYHLIEAYKKMSHQLAVRPGVTQKRHSRYGLNRISTHRSSTPSTVIAFCVGVTRIYSGKVLVLEEH